MHILVGEGGMKIVLIALLLCAGSAEFAAADSLPVNPWAAQRQTVKISRTGENTQQAAPQTAETPQWVIDRVAAVRRNNERVRAEYEAMEKAKVLMQQQAAADAAQNSDSGFLDKLGGFFSDDKKTAASQPQPSAGSGGDFDIPGKELLDGYNNLKGETEKSVRKLKRNFNSLTNINIEKTIDDTLKSLQ